MGKRSATASQSPHKTRFRSNLITDIASGSSHFARHAQAGSTIEMQLKEEQRLEELSENDLSTFHSNQLMTLKSVSLANCLYRQLKVEIGLSN
jgi:hypothetical protein